MQVAKAVSVDTLRHTALAARTLCGAAPLTVLPALVPRHTSGEFGENSMAGLDDFEILGERPIDFGALLQVRRAAHRSATATTAALASRPRRRARGRVRRTGVVGGEGGGGIAVRRTLCRPVSCLCRLMFECTAALLPAAALCFPDVSDAPRLFPPLPLTAASSLRCRVRALAPCLCPRPPCAGVQHSAASITPYCLDHIRRC